MAVIIFPSVRLSYHGCFSLFFLKEEVNSNRDRFAVKCVFCEEFASTFLWGERLQSDRADHRQPASSSKSQAVNAAVTPSSSVATSVPRAAIQDDRDGHLIYKEGDIIHGRCKLVVPLYCILLLVPLYELRWICPKKSAEWLFKHFLRPLNIYICVRLFLFSFLAWTRKPLKLELYKAVRRDHPLTAFGLMRKLKND